MNVTEEQVLDAMARVRARWDHPPLDPRDVFERAAVRLGDDVPELRVVPHFCACRVFVRRGEGAPWVSRYVHELGDVDVALDELLQRLAAARRDAA